MNPYEIGIHETHCINNSTMYGSQRTARHFLYALVPDPVLSEHITMGARTQEMYARTMVYIAKFRDDAVSLAEAPAPQGLGMAGATLGDAQLPPIFQRPEPATGSNAITPKTVAGWLTKRARPPFTALFFRPEVAVMTAWTEKIWQLDDIQQFCSANPETLHELQCIHTADAVAVLQGKAIDRTEEESEFEEDDDPWAVLPPETEEAKKSALKDPGHGWPWASFYYDGPDAPNPCEEPPSAPAADAAEQSEADPTADGSDAPKKSTRRTASSYRKKKGDPERTVTVPVHPVYELAATEMPKRAWPPARGSVSGAPSTQNPAHAVQSAGRAQHEMHGGEPPAPSTIPAGLHTFWAEDQLNQHGYSTVAGGSNLSDPSFAPGTSSLPYVRSTSAVLPCNALSCLTPPSSGIAKFDKERQHRDCPPPDI